MVKKILVLIFVALGLIFLGQHIFNLTYKFPEKVEYGVTFSPQYAKYLNLDWKEVFIKSLDELKIRNFRLPTYWSFIEKIEGKLDFQEVDFMLLEAEKREAKVILTLGFRQPRWPECYLPSWAKDLKLEQKRAKILNFIQATIERYEDREAIWAYQIENEPFLPFFGEDCDKGDVGFLTEEINLVRSISQKPIIISDSGELGTWIAPIQYSDIFGTTLYREVYNSIMGYFSYPTLPYLYNLKSQIIGTIFAPKNQKTIIVELQAEPWIGTKDLENNPEKMAEVFSVKEMESYVKFAKDTGFSEVYLWGVEWWYFMAKNGHPEYLDFAKTLF